MYEAKTEAKLSIYQPVHEGLMMKPNSSSSISSRKLLGTQVKYPLIKCFTLWPQSSAENIKLSSIFFWIPQQILLLGGVINLQLAASLN